MNKSNQNHTIDKTLVCLLTATGISSFIFLLGLGHRSAFFRLLHKWTGLGLLTLSAYHLYLHWDNYSKADYGKEKELSK